MQNKRAFRLLLTANAITQFSQGICMLAIPWYFTKIINKPALFGLMYAVVTIATIFWNPIAGAIIDRYRRKKIYLLTAFITGFILLLVAVYGYMQGFVPMLLVMFVFCVNLFNSNIQYPNIYAFAQEVTEKENYKKVNSYLEIQGQVTMMVSGALAVILIAGVPQGNIDLFGATFHVPFKINAWSLQKIFLLNAATYFFSMVFISVIQYTATIQRNIETGSVINRLKTGFHFLKNNLAIFLFGNASYSIFVTVMVGSFFLFPMYVSNHLQKGGQVYAASEFFFAMGAASSGVLLRWVLNIRNYLLAIIFMLTLTILVFTLGYFSKSVTMFYAICLFVGLTNAGTRILRVTYLFNHVSNDLIGRVNSVFAVINILIRFFFLLLFSLAFFTFGNNVIYSFLILAVFLVLSLILLLLYYHKMKKM